MVRSEYLDGHAACAAVMQPMLDKALKLIVDPPKSDQRLIDPCGGFAQYGALLYLPREYFVEEALAAQKWQAEYQAWRRERWTAPDLPPFTLDPV